MCKVLSYLPLYLQSLVQCLTHLLFIMWMNNFVAKFSKNSVLTLFHWHSWVLPLVWNTFFSFGFCVLTLLFSYSSAPFLCVLCRFLFLCPSFTCWCFTFLPCQHFFTLCILSLKALINPHGLNYHLSLSFSHLQPWSLSFTCRVIDTPAYWNECLSQSVY